MNADLSIRDLSLVYQRGARAAVDGVSLDVPAGSCTALLGPSGSGKSTTLRLIAGLAAPDRGDIAVDGVSMRGVAAHRRGMAMLFQRPLLFPHLSVIDNVAFAARVTGTPRRLARAAAADYLRMVQLNGFGDRRTSELSGGQEQRVALARALAANPRVLLLDEPFSALDTALRADMHELLLALRAVLRSTIVLVTHDQAEAALLADAVAVLSAGRLLQHDASDRVYHRPATLDVARIMGGRNEIPGRVINGRHMSPLGRLDLPADLRTPDRDATLVIRHESVTITTSTDDTADVHGMVTRTRAHGARLLASVDVAGPAAASSTTATVLHAEAAPGQRVTVGERVGLRLPLDARAVVTTPTMETGRPG